MAFVITNFIGFETGNSQEAVATGGTPSYGTTTGVNSGTYALELENGGDYFQFLIDPFGLKTTPTYFCVGAYFEFSDATPTVATSILRIRDDAGETIFSLFISTSGYLGLADVDGVAATSTTTVLQNSTTYKIELRIFCDNTSGYAYVYLDDNSTPEVSMTSRDTLGAGNPETIRLVNNDTGTSTYYVDDVYVKSDTATSSTSDLIGVGDGLDWEIPGYYQPVTGGISQGTTPGAGSIANLGENPLNDSNGAEWQTNGDDADWAADGTRAGPTTDITGTVLAGKWWYRAEDEGNVDVYLQNGKYNTTPTWTHTENLYALGNSPADYFIVSATNVPSTTSDSFAWGIRIDGSKDAWIYEVGGWFLQTVSSGTAFQRSVSDTVGITDTISRVIGRYKTISDSVGVTDTVSTARNLYKTIADAVGVTDTVVRSAGIYKTLSDNVGITDTVSRALIIFASISDTIGITDTLTTAIIRVVTVQNNVGITDTTSTARNLYKTIADAVGVTDTVVTARGIKKTLADTVGITDVLSRSLVILAAIADSVGITDSLTTSIIRAVTLQNSVGVTDTLTTARNIVKSIADNVGITDALTTARDIVISLADSIGITDVIDAVKGAAAKYATITDTVGITDTVSTVRDLKITLAEALGVTDEIFTARDIKTLFAEAVGITDTVTGYRKIFVTLVDTIGITDTIATVVTFVAQKVLKTIISTLGIIAVTSSEEE